MPEEIGHFYGFIGKKKLLKILEFINQKPINKELHLEELFKNLKLLRNLELINLSNNYFIESELKLIDKFFSYEP